jgi:integrase
MATVRKKKGSKFYHVDIWIDGRQFSRSTKKTSEREAQRVVAAIEEELKSELAAQSKSDKQAEDGIAFELDAVAERYMLDIGDHHAGKNNTERLLELIVNYFGAGKLITDITHGVVQEMVRWRRTHTVGKGKNKRPIGAYTVNDTTEQLKKLFTYMRPILKKANPDAEPFPHEPEWKTLWIAEPKRKARELVGDEEQRLVTSVFKVRPDLWPLMQFSRACGKRKTNCYTLEWTQVNWPAGEIKMIGKGVAGGKPITVKITPAIRAIIWPLRGQHPARVFTMSAQRTVDKVIKGKRHVFVKGQHYPWERDGLRAAWDNVRADAGLTGDNRFRWHDLRSDFGSKLLRSVKSAQGMKMVQRALDHEDIKTTLDFYAHVMEEEHFSAVERLAQERAVREMQWSVQEPRQSATAADHKDGTTD